MPQREFPIFPEGVTHITPTLAFKKEQGKIVYFNGSMPVFSHDETDDRSFSLITSQFCINGVTKLVDIVKTFGVSASSVKRRVKIYRREGPGGFFKKPKGRAKFVMTDDVCDKAQELLNQFKAPKAVALELGLKWDTFRKAISSGRLHRPEKKVRRQRI